MESFIIVGCEFCVMLFLLFVFKFCKSYLLKNYRVLSISIGNFVPLMRFSSFLSKVLQLVRSCSVK